MTLKFVKEPVKKVKAEPVAAPAGVLKPRKRVMRRKSLLMTDAKPRVVKEDYAVDQFGELGELKRNAEKQARVLGHDLSGWHRRDNDVHGRWNSFCATCNKLVVVSVDPPHNLPRVYGHAVTDDCAVRPHANPALDGVVESVPVD